MDYAFVTHKSEPNDVDILLVAADAFDAPQLRGEAPLLFDHGAAQAHFGVAKRAGHGRILASQARWWPEGGIVEITREEAS